MFLSLLSFFRTPPVEPDHGSAGGSESGASVIESVGGLEQASISGRSSAYEIGTASGRTPAREMSEEAMQFDFAESGASGTNHENYSLKLHTLRLKILEQLLGYVPQMRDIGGVSIILYQSWNVNVLLHFLNFLFFVRFVPFLSCKLS